MSPLLKSLGIDQLDIGDRITLVQEIWDSIASEGDTLALTDAQNNELDRRLAAQQSNPGDAAPWDVVKERATARMKG